MNTSKFALIISLGSILIVCPGLHATVYPNPLAIHVQNFGSASPAPTNVFELRLYSLTPPYSPLFETMTFSASDAGKIFPVTQAQDPDFNALRGILVNGVSDTIEFDLSFDHFGGIASGAAAGEKLFFQALPSGNNGIDFQGFPIDNIALRLDSVSFLPSSYNVQATILVNSAPVPEPSTGVLAALSGVLIAVFARKKKR